MKSLISLFCVLFALVALTAKAANITGELYATNGKHLFCHDFQTGNDTCVLKDIVIQSPCDVSENGRVIWITAEDGKMHLCELSSESEHVLKGDAIIYTVANGTRAKFKEHDVELFKEFERNLLPGQKVTNVTFSPLGTKCSFEADMKGDGGWTLVQRGSPLDRAWYAQNDRSAFSAVYMGLPMYTRCEPGSFHGILVAGVSKDRILKKYFRCGNSYEYPGAPEYRPTTPPHPGMAGVLAEEMTTPDILGGLMRWSVLDCCQRCSYQRDAYFAAWSKDDRRLAYIHQVPPNNKWGQLTIRSFEQWERNAGDRVTKPGICEVENLWMDSCEGIAWMSDGSLTLRKNNDGKVYKIGYDQIDQAVANSGVINTNRNNPLSATSVLVATNTTFRAKVEEMPAYEVRGTRWGWTPNSAIYIRRNDGGLYVHDLQKEGRPEKLLSRVPEEFFYRNRRSSPLSPPATIANDTGSEDSSSACTEVKSGTDRVLNRHRGSSLSGLPTAEVGTIRFNWDPVRGGINGKKMISLYIQCLVAQGKIGSKTESVLLRGENLDEIKDPSAYRYRKPLGGNWIDDFAKDDAIIYKDSSGRSFTGIQVLSFDDEWLDFKWRVWSKKVHPQSKGDLVKSDLGD